MRALIVEPNTANSARLEDVAPPQPSEGAVLVRALALQAEPDDVKVVLDFTQ
jgi:NADPH:quinone reductase-like Zn-dependent oxidoreductase